MSKKEGKATVGCRVLDSTVLEIDDAAEAAGMNRAEWIEYAIAKALGKRPRFTVINRLAKVEAQLKELMSDRA